MASRLPQRLQLQLQPHPRSAPGSLTRRAFIKRGIALSLTVPALPALLAACGGDDDDDDGEDTSNAPVATATTLPAATATTAPAPTATAAAATPTQAAAAAPRVVSLGWEDELTALGVIPVGYGLTYTEEILPFLADKLANSESVGAWYEPNLEAILALEPELILGYAGSHDELLSQLEAIAPTQLLPFTEFGGSQGVRENIMAVGGALGMEEQATALADEFDAYAAEAKTKLAETVGAETVALFRAGFGEFALGGVTSGYTGPVLYHDLGLTPPPFVAELDDPGYNVISLEVIPDVQAEHIFFVREDNDLMESILADPLWKDQPAVKNGKLYMVDWYHWLTTSIQADRQKIDDVLGFLGG